MARTAPNGTLFLVPIKPPTPPAKERRNVRHDDPSHPSPHAA
jgi:hypothetical protein